MTPTLVFGGLFALGLAALFIFRPPLEAGDYRLPRIFLALLGPVMGAMMMGAAYSQGQSTADSPTIESRLAGQVRIALTDASIPIGEQHRQITIGGDRARDAVVIGDAPEVMMALRAANGGIVIAAGAQPDDGPRADICLNGQRLGPGDNRTVAEARLAISISTAPVPPDRCGDPAQLAKANYRNLLVQLMPAEPDGKPLRWHIGFLDPELRFAKGGRVQPASADLVNQPREGKNVVAFTSLGGMFAPLLEQVELVLPQASGLETYVLGRTPGPQANTNVPLSALGFEVDLRVDPLNLTSGLRGWARFILLMVLTVSLFATLRMRCRSPLAAALFAVAEVLLTLRVLISIEGGMVEETIRSRGALGDSLLAFPLVLLALALAIAPWRRIPVLVTLLGGCAIAAWCLIALVSGSVPETSLRVVQLFPLLIVAIVLIRLVPGWAAPLFAPPWRAVESRLPRTLPAGLDPAWLPPALQSLGMAVAILVLRLGFAAAGMEERIPGFIALSMIFVPLTLLATTPLLAQLARAADANALLTGGCLFLAFLLLGVLLPNIMVGDDGLGLVLLIALTLAGAAARLTNPVPVARREFAAAICIALGLGYLVAILAAGAGAWWLLVPLALIGASLALFVRARAAGQRSAILATSLWLVPSATLMSIVLLAAVPALRPAPPLVAGAVPGWLAEHTVVLRGLAVLAPERLDEIDRSTAAQTREALESVRIYGATPGGRGFLNLPLPPVSVKNQQFSDFAVAIHVISPFGRFAAAGIILLLGAFALLGFPAGPDTSGRVWLGALAVITFATTSVYIILANASLAPVTGRNAYLLAVQSHSDLVEGALLLVMAGALLVARGNGRRA